MKNEPVMPAGLYVRIGRGEYRVIREGGWALWSASPAPGFKKSSGARGYVRPIAPQEKLECHRVSQRGTYQGLAITVYPSSEGRVMVTTRDAKAVDLGFDTLERQEWVKIVPATDPQLRFSTTRTPTQAPWISSRGRTS